MIQPLRATKELAQVARPGRGKCPYTLKTALQAVDITNFAGLTSSLACLKPGLCRTLNCQELTQICRAIVENTSKRSPLPKQSFMCDLYSASPCVVSREARTSNRASIRRVTRPRPSSGISSAAAMRLTGSLLVSLMSARAGTKTVSSNRSCADTFAGIAGCAVGCANASFTAASMEPVSPPIARSARESCAARSGRSPGKDAPN